MPQLTTGLRLDEIVAVVSGGGAVPTNCWTPLIQLTDGGYGKDSAQTPTGVLVPEYTSGGTLIYSSRFYATGVFIHSFGDAGITQLFQDEAQTLPVNLLIFEYGKYHIELIWNETNTRYEGTNPEAATAILENLGNNVCYSAIAIPGVLVWYDFATLEVEE